MLAAVHHTPRAADAAKAPPTRIRIYGSILDSHTMLEVMNALMVTGWDGDLHVRSGRKRYRLSIAQRALKAATSDADEHRLGELLVRRGLLSRAQLQECLREQGEGRRIGQLLVEKGWIESTCLFAELRAQAKRIFEDACSVSSGRFVLTRTTGREPANAISFHLPLDRLLLEGATRIDEKRLFRTRITSDDVRPMLTSALDSYNVDAQTRAIAAHLDGRCTIREIADRTTLTEHDVTRAVYRLLEQDMAVVGPTPVGPCSALSRLFDQFDAVLQRVLAAVPDGPDRAEIQASIGDLISAASLSSLVGERLLSSGAVDRNCMTAALAALDTGTALEAAHQVLHDLTTFALYAAGAKLPRHKEAALARDVQRRLHAIAVPPHTTRINVSPDFRCRKDSR
jgi:hypothetical protein